MREVTAEELTKMIERNEKIHLVDVREPYENEEFNIGGPNIPLGELMNHEAELKALSQSGEIVFYCRSGNRSVMAQKILAARMGIDNTINLRGGMNSWRDRHLQ
jgi:rhodanese-related sulfurtransferase